MSNPNIIVNINENGIAEIILNRPDKHNAFDDSLITNLTNILHEIDLIPQVRVVTLSANGKNFSAGADLEWMQRMIKFSHEENLADAAGLAQMLKTLNNLSKPTIALVQGAAFGGGIGLIACCDLAIATTDANFCFSEVKLGLVPATISPYIIATIGSKAARRYFLTAERFDAKTAVNLGLIQQLVTYEELKKTGMDFAKQLINNSPQAMKTTKHLLQQLQNIDEALIEKTINIIADARVSLEGQEGLAAFFAKRKPNWQM